jgi:hypothetical protein
LKIFVTGVDGDRRELGTGQGSIMAIFLIEKKLFLTPPLPTITPENLKISKTLLYQYF